MNNVRKSAAGLTAGVLVMLAWSVWARATISDFAVKSATRLLDLAVYTLNIIAI